MSVLAAVAGRGKTNHDTRYYDFDVSPQSALI